VLFVTAAELLDDLRAEVAQTTFRRKLTKYASPQVLVIDEVGYLSYDHHAADLLDKVVDRRYERKSIVLTTNLAFRDWNTVFPNATSIATLLDKLTHHADVTTIEGDSYRVHASPPSRRCWRYRPTPDTSSSWPRSSDPSPVRKPHFLASANSHGTGVVGQGFAGRPSPQQGRARQRTAVMGGSTCFWCASLPRGVHTQSPGRPPDDRGFVSSPALGPEDIRGRASRRG
jgi:hypothetical protein